MMVSTKGRYALRVMIDLAEHRQNGYIPLKDIAKRQELSEKYLEAILPAFIKNGFLLAVRGKGGGYKLARDPKTYTAGSILKLVESNLAPVACLKEEPLSCARVTTCKTLPLWQNLDKVIDDYLEGVTLADLCEGKLKIQSV